MREEFGNTKGKYESEYLYIEWFNMVHLWEKIKYKYLKFMEMKFNLLIFEVVLKIKKWS